MEMKLDIIKTAGKTKKGLNILGVVIIIALLIGAIYLVANMFGTSYVSKQCLEEDAEEICHRVFSTYIPDSVNIETGRYECSKNDETYVEYFTLQEMKDCTFKK